jgi:hypothetical protein
VIERVGTREWAAAERGACWRSEAHRDKAFGWCLSLREITRRVEVVVVVVVVVSKSERASE